MTANACPVCGCGVAEVAQRCGACCTDLGGWDTELSPLRAWRPVDSSGALWLADLAGPRAPTPTAASETLSAPAPLRGAAVAPPAAALRSQAPALSAPSVEAQPPAPFARRATDALGTAPLNEAELRSAQKAARRAQVRSARLHGTAASRAFGPADAEVLVVDPDPVSRAQLCHVLGAFGFGVLTVADPQSAAAPAAPRGFVAVFVSLAAATVDGGDGIDFCQQWLGAGHHADAVVLVGARLRPVDRVRAELAGCDQTISLPVTRGTVARVLDDRGIMLPSDARRS